MRKEKGNRGGNCEAKKERRKYKRKEKRYSKKRECKETWNLLPMVSREGGRKARGRSEREEVGRWTTWCTR